MYGFKNVNDLQKKEVAPGFHGHLLHTQQVTISHFYIDAGSILPEHHHVHEQISNVVSGEFEMTVGAETKLLKTGDIAVIASNVPHSGKALSDCYIVDVFQPVREDYK